MRTQWIDYPDQRAICVFPDESADLAPAISMLGLEDGYPVIVLIGGDIQEQQAVVTRQAIQTLAKTAEDTKALVICGGIDVGIMADIGQERWQKQDGFPLIGITLEALVTWPGGPRSKNFCGGDRNVGCWLPTTPISSLYLAVNLGMSRPGSLMQPPSYPKIISR